MTRLQTRHDVTLDVESCSLDELAAQIGCAIGRVLAALGERSGNLGSQDAERRVRAWISGLDARSRSCVLATVLSPTWPRGCEAIVAEIVADAPRFMGQHARARA